MRPSNIQRPTQLTTNLPEDVRRMLDKHLYDPIHQRIPKGAYSRFLTERIREFFQRKR